jgi:hypothetical protein
MLLRHTTLFLSLAIKRTRSLSYCTVIFHPIIAPDVLDVTCISVSPTWGCFGRVASRSSCRRGRNPFDYLTELDRHADKAGMNPQHWMPWNYRHTLTATTAPPAVL